MAQTPSSEDAHAVNFSTGSGSRTMTRFLSMVTLVCAPWFLYAGITVEAFCRSSVGGRNRIAQLAQTKNADDTNMMSTFECQEKSCDRRNYLKNLFAAMAGAGIGTQCLTEQAFAQETEIDSSTATLPASDLESVYFGVGCFWHIQHEFVVAERDLLQRNKHQFTSLTGYAGGKATDNEGRVCYHNMRGVADYGKLGHTEVVNLMLPKDKVVEFSDVYFSLFNPKTGDRVDPQDRGPEYRSAIGLPGGVAHPLFGEVKSVASGYGFELREGKGNDPDTLGKKIVWVYDNSKFPFYQAEVYHQYHNDFQSLPYGRAYNALADLALEEGRMVTTGCPDRV